MRPTFLNSCVALLGTVSVAALTIPAVQAAPADDYIAALDTDGSYLSGDKHNHTTCTDGSMSVTTTVNESILTYGLDWFAQTGHGGEGPRDCRFDDPEYDGSGSGDGLFWEESVGFDGIEGDVETTGGFGGGAFSDDGAREMWRWQMLNDFVYKQQRDAGQLADRPTWLGIETNAPGHEHVSMAISNGQFSSAPTTYNTGQFEYLFDRSDDDTSGGDDFENPSNNNGFAKPVGPDNGDAESGTSGHEIAVDSVEWLRDNFGTGAYYVPAHVERQGGFVSTADRGWNVEHFRDVHNAGLLNPNEPRGESIAFGAEMLAGHQFANGGRGTYEADRPTAGFGTYGGAGAYSGAEVSLPGRDFDGTELTNARLTEIRTELNALFEDRLTEPSGSDQYDQLNACSDCADPAPDGIGTSVRERFVLGRPGIGTMWDSLLSEGRRFYNFGSSDWHNRGTFGPFEPQSTLDAWPGEYSKIYSYARIPEDRFGFNGFTAQRIIDGMRSGNTYSVHGDLIDDFVFVMCQGDRCATMGERLIVLQSGDPVEYLIRLRDPEGTNNAPYTFDNPSLLQIGLNTPINEPVLSHVDIVRGDVTGIISPDDPDYATQNNVDGTELFARFDNLADEFSAPDTDGFITVRGTIPAADFTNDMYFRVRGTNMPVGTPNETDAAGNPLLDDYSSLVPCTATGGEAVDVAEVTTATLASTGNSSFRAGQAVNGTFDPAACPAHLPIDENGVKFLDADVESWTDLWFYANPIFVVAR